MLTNEEKRELLVIARDAIETLVRRRGRSPTRSVVHQRLSQQCGAFVTLRLDHQLRGCIGYIESARPLSEVVEEVAGKAATEDPRFQPLSVFELDQIDIEISILSPLIRISSINEIVIGVHGVVLELGGMRGLLLPQVAVEHQLERETFLNAVAKKAGLGTYAWKDPNAKVYVFTAEVVQEADVTRP
jgi:AmmeMemoRadiSam system protein A